MSARETAKPNSVMIPYKLYEALCHDQKLWKQAQVRLTDVQQRECEKEAREAP